jgi:O-antigen/teichoic acid export membrane protein
MPAQNPSPPDRPVAPLARRAGFAAMWIGVGYAVNQAIRLGSSIVLTRLLAPEMYGLMTMGMVVISAVVMLSDFGFAQSVIHNKRGDEPRFLNTIWTLQLIRGAVLCALMNAFALGLHLVNVYHPGWLQGSYAHPDLPKVLVMMSLVAVAMAIESTNLARAHRMLAIAPLVRNEVIGQTLSTALAIVLALRWPSVWVLPLGWVISAGTVALLSHLNLPGPKNRLAWDRSAACEAWHFSKWILLSSALTYLFREGDRLLLGGMLSPTEMGVYSVGCLLMSATQQVVVKLVTNVGMPALSEIAREQPTRLREAYRRCRLPIDALCVSAAGFFFASADSIIGLLYDNRYSGAGHTLSVLSLGLITSRYWIMDQYFMATGETRQLFKRGLVQTVALYISVPIGFAQAGLTGALIGILLAQASTMPLMLKAQHDRGLLDWRFELSTLAFFPAGWLVGGALSLVLR